MKFDEVIERFFQAIDQGRKNTVEKLRPFINVYLQLIGSGVDSKKARKIMDLYVE